MSALLGIVALIVATTATTANPDMALYQLKKNCEQTAAETFRRESGNDEDRDYYRAHYNANLNICFYVEASYPLPQRALIDGLICTI